MGSLDGQRAAITGGASGIGRATARAMATEGATVAVLDVDEAGAKEVAAEIGGHAYTVDVTDFAGVEAALIDASRAMNGLTLLFNNAGVGNIAPLHEYELDEWARIVAVNLTGVFHGFKAGVPLIQSSGGGAIVSTSSISGTRPSAGEAPYSAAKAAVAAITANAALEYGPDIRVNAVAPGMIRTQLTEPLLAGLPHLSDRYIADTPVGRIGEPEDVADLVVFLCSDRARFITGQNIVVDGGMTLHGAGVDGVLADVQRMLGNT
ncbi:MAG TPA: SDR family NAD(P)-dependent oxidoreductase [Acidimicrobiia bacterium]|nr:SDR family NAD(P)-dependent oxidoreductase [Acidimicrobiia bacterium]